MFKARQPVIGSFKRIQPTTVLPANRVHSGSYLYRTPPFLLVPAGQITTFALAPPACIPLGVSRTSRLTGLTPTSGSSPHFTDEDTEARGGSDSPWATPTAGRGGGGASCPVARAWMNRGTTVACGGMFCACPGSPPAHVQKTWPPGRAAVAWAPRGLPCLRLDSS